MAAKRKRKALKKLSDARGSAKASGSRTAKSASRRSWLERAGDVSDEDVKYVVDHGVDRADEMAEGAKDWLTRLARRIRTLYDMLVAWWLGRFDFPKSSVAAITLALLYFINPFDLVPDVLPVVGLVDEAMVFAFMASMMKEDLERYAKKFGLKRSEVGL